MDNPVEIEEEARNKIDDSELSKLTLRIYEDEIEDIHDYTVSWRALCGYFSVTFHCGTADEARTLFNALQAVDDVSES